MKYKVKLRLFEDEATGEWGLAHDNAIDVNQPFNAFWSEQGIFHDVFEHYFEDNHFNFLGDAAFNLGGEVAAMGHLSYYWSHFYLEERRLSRISIYNFEDSILQTTLGEMTEAIKYGYTQYGSELVCTVPYQKIADITLEDIIENHWEHVKKLRFERELGKINFDQQQEREESEIFRKSVTKSKLQRLYRWGYYQAQKIAPNTSENYDTLREFLSFWRQFVKKNNAEEMATYFWAIEFTIHGGKKLKWDAEWITNEGHRIDGKTLYPEEAQFELFTEENY